MIRRGKEHFLVGEGGHRNTDHIPPTEVRVEPPLRKVDEFRFTHPINPYGEGSNKVTIYKDARDKIVAVHKFHWCSNLGYSWDECWETVTDNPEKIEKLRAFKDTEVLKENL